MSITDYLKEGIDGAFFDRQVKKIARMTDQNDHNGARIAGAELIAKVDRNAGKRFLERYNAIETIARTEGSMPRELMDYRFSVDQRMWGLAKNLFDKEQYEAFHGAY
jgi:hypothetical protein